MMAAACFLVYVCVRSDFTGYSQALDKWTQSYELRAVIERADGGADHIHPKLPLHVHLYGETDEGAWEQLAVSQVDRQVDCPAGPTCEPVALVQASFIKHRRLFYRIEQSLKSSTSSTTGSAWMGTFTFRQSFINPEYAKQELIVRAAFAGVLAITALAYAWRINDVKALGNQSTVGLGWMALPCIGAILFVNPFLFLEYQFPELWSYVLNVVIQVLGLAMLMAFWLVEFVALASSVPNSDENLEPSKRFAVLPLAFVTVQALVAIGLVVTIAAQLADDPLYDWEHAQSQGSNLMRAFQYTSLALGILYMLAFLAALSKAMVRLGVCCSPVNVATAGQIIMWILHVLVAVSAGIALVTTAFVSLHPETSTHVITLHVLFTAYVLVLQALYWPALHGPAQLLDDEQRSDAGADEAPMQAITIEMTGVSSTPRKHSVAQDEAPAAAVLAGAPSEEADKPDVAELVPADEAAANAAVATAASGEASDVASDAGASGAEEAVPDAQPGEAGDDAAQEKTAEDADA